MGWEKIRRSLTVAGDLDAKSDSIDIVEIKDASQVYASGDRLIQGQLHQKAEATYTADADIDGVKLPLSAVPDKIKLQLKLEADMKQNAGVTATLSLIFSNATAQLQTAATAYTSLSTVIDSISPADSELLLRIAYGGAGTAFIKNVSGVLYTEYTATCTAIIA